MERPDLQTFFSPLFRFGLRLNQSLSGGSGSSPPYEDVCREIGSLHARAKSAAAEAGKRPADIEEATFAVVAWLDEIMARAPAWLGPGEPLQVKLFRTHNAGDEFFDHLAALARDQDEVREVYFLCLCLGFVGKHYLDAGERGELARIKETHSRQLPHAPASVHTLHQEYVTPQPYASKGPGPPRLPSHWDRLLLRASAALAVVAPMMALVYYFFRTPAQQPPPPPPPPVSVEKKVFDVLASFECKDLKPVIDEQNRVTVSGRVTSDGDAVALENQLRAIEGVTDVTTNVEVVQWPYCEVLEILAQYPSATKFGLAVETTKGSSVYREGEFLVLTLDAPEYGSYVYVDYWQLDESVVHLLPNNTQADNEMSAQQHLLLGDDKQKQRWDIASPFGREMIVAMASPSPLLPTNRPPREPAEEYLQALRKRIAASQKESDNFAADYLFIETRKKP